MGISVLVWSISNLLWGLGVCLIIIIQRCQLLMPFASSPSSVNHAEWSNCKSLHPLHLFDPLSFSTYLYILAQIYSFLYPLFPSQATTTCSSGMCGFRNPKAKKEESELPWKSPTSKASTKPSKRSRIKSFFSSSRKSKKISYSIAELDKRRQNIIYTQDREVSLVHFVYSGPTNLIPVVAKQKNKNQPKKPDNLMTLAYGSRQPLQVVDSEAIKEQFKERRVESTGLSKERSFVSSSNRETSWYLAAALALILLVVVSSGKPFAIFCCSVFWYLVPALRGKEANVGKHQWIRRKIYKCG